MNTLSMVNDTVDSLDTETLKQMIADSLNFNGRIISNMDRSGGTISDMDRSGRTISDMDLKKYLNMNSETGRTISDKDQAKYLERLANYRMQGA